MVKVISVINMKGGVGKTTLAVNLAYGLAKFHHKKILLVDVDPQFNATQYLYPIKDYLKFIKNPSKCTIKDIFLEKPDSFISTVKKVTGTKSKIANSNNSTIRIYDNDKGFLDLIPSTLQLMEADNFTRGIEHKLKGFLDKIKEKYDFIIIDCPPTLSVFTASAYLACDGYLIAIKPDFLSSMGINLLLRAMKEYENTYAVKRENYGIIFTMVNYNTKLAKHIMAQVRKIFDKNCKIFDSHISHTTKIANTVGENKTIFDIKLGRYANEMKNITQEFIDSIGGD